MLKSVWFVIGLSSLLYASDIQTVIGQRAYLSVEETGLQYLARVDTGARTSSLHALNIVIKGKKSLIHVNRHAPLRINPLNKPIKNENYRQDIGSIIEFDTLNERGEMRHMLAPVVNVSKVNNAQGSEYRYVVRLALKYGDVVKFTDVNLRDRSQMRHKLLIGRNWLKNDFTVDISKDVE